MATRVAINGFGRIGRAFLRTAFGDKDLEIVAINDLADPKTLKYLLRYDSVYGRYEKDPQGVKFLAEKDPMKLPWSSLGVDIVVESTGLFTSAEKAQAHIAAGAKRVVITAPTGDDVVTALVGVNDDRFSTKNPITSNASCTTNSVAPVMQIILETFGVKSATMPPVHGYTASQKLVEGPAAKAPRRGRAAAANIVPSTTCAAEAVIQSIPELEGKFQAESIRVPTITGSISITSAFVEKSTTCEEVNEVFKKAAKNQRWAKVLKVTEDPIVSSDIVGEPYGAIVDLSLTQVLGGDLVKVFSWYDNEAGYTATLVEHVRRVADMLI